MSEIDQQFVEYIVKSLVSDPDAVEIERTIDEKGVLLQLKVSGEDLGRVIGKRGATAQSIRTLLRALGTKNDARYNLKIVDTGEGMPPKPEKRREEEPRDEAPVEEESAPETPADEAPSEPEAVEEAPVEEPEQEEEEKSSADRLREGLDDLDDLDI